MVSKQMKWFNKLERKYGKYAINNLMLYIIGIYAFGFILDKFFPAVYAYWFSLDAQKILHGQIWRIVTYILQPPTTNFIFILFSLYLYYMIGTVLERTWGAFRFNVYFFMGVLLQVIAAIIIYLFTGYNLQLNTYYINLALFMAFAMVMPDTVFYLFFVIPVKVKWLAYFDAAFFAATIIFGYMTPWLSVDVWLKLFSMGIIASPEIATAALIAMINFMAFFIISRTSKKTKGQKAYRQFMKENNKANAAGSRQASSRSGNQSGAADMKGSNQFHKITKHKCAVCGRTENDGDDLIFRFCSKCVGNYEYCNEHLYTHKHITNETNEKVSNEKVSNFSNHK